MKQDKILICDSYLSLTAACSQYQDNWLCDETWVRLLIAHYPHLKKTCSLTRMLSKISIGMQERKGQFQHPHCEMHLEGPANDGENLEV